MSFGKSDCKCTHSFAHSGPVTIIPCVSWVAFNEIMLLTLRNSGLTDKFAFSCGFFFFFLISIEIEMWLDVDVEN